MCRVIDLLRHQEQSTSSPFQATVRWEAGEVIVAVAGELDIAGLPALDAVLAQLYDAEPRSVSLDTTELTFLDPGGLSGLLEMRAILRGKGGDLTIRSPSRAIWRLQVLCGPPGLDLQQLPRRRVSTTALDDRLSTARASAGQGTPERFKRPAIAPALASGDPGRAPGPPQAPASGRSAPSRLVDWFRQQMRVRRQVPVVANTNTGRHDTEDIKTPIAQNERTNDGNAQRTPRSIKRNGRLEYTRRDEPRTKRIIAPVMLERIIRGDR